MPEYIRLWRFTTHGPDASWRAGLLPKDSPELAAQVVEALGWMAEAVRGGRDPRRELAAEEKP